MQLAEYVRGVSAKTLSSVEADRRASNQHEFNGTVAMRAYLGFARRVIPARFLYVDDAEDALVEDQGTVTWYDAREAHPSRSEYRLYFRDNRVMALAAAEDLLITALLPDDDSMLVIVARSDSPQIPELLWLFGLSSIPGPRFETPQLRDAGPRPLSVCSMIAERLGVELPEPSTDRWLDLLLATFGGTYPTTREFSRLARETLAQVDPRGDPDSALIACMDREEEMFRQYERHLLAEELQTRAETWVRDVDDFVSFSLSVQNRRKTRAGSAFENHVEWVLRSAGLVFERGVTTEDRSRPDFLFPGQREYLTPEFPSSRLQMLGVKTSCKDRWRQILNEAKRVERKHLLTLDPAITPEQLAEMQRSSVNLVVPAGIAVGYVEVSRAQLMSVRDFIDAVRQHQGTGQSQLF